MEQIQRDASVSAESRTRSRTSMDTLLTPPNSGDSKPVDSFDGVAVQEEKYDPGRLFRDRTHSQSPPVARYPLFSPYQKEIINRDQKPHSPLTTEATETIVDEWLKRPAVDWQDSNTAGETYPTVSQSWDKMEKQHGRNGTIFKRCSKEEYMLVATFFEDMSAYGASEKSEPSLATRGDSIPRESPRKVLQDRDPKRRSHTNLAPSSRKHSTTPHIADMSSSRRRSSKASAKGAGAEQKTARAPSSKPAKDPEWRHYIDYAPSFQYARDPMKAANDAHKFDTKDNKKGRRDLSADPDRNHLHESELIVASWLHLDCRRFLTSKRQIFQGYVELLSKRAEVDRRVREGKEERGQTKVPNWNKTEAQKTLGIDVSKGSYIWQFYADLHWFDKENEYLYEKHINSMAAA